MATKQAPYSQEAEEAVIGSVLLKPLVYLNVAAFLKADDFFFKRHNYLWTAFGNIEKRGDEIDTVTMSVELQAMGVLAEIGGPAYLSKLISITPTAQHAEIYGHLVERTSFRRKLLIAGDAIKALAYDESIETNKIREKAESKLLNVTGYGIEEKANDIATIGHNYMDDVEKLIALREQGIMPGLPTGFVDVDNIIIGSFKGELIVTAGPAKSGKSTYNLNVARARAKLGARVVIYITEMSAEAITRKFISMETGIPVEVMKSASFSPQQYSLFVAALQRVSQWPVHIIDSYTSLTPVDVRRELRKITHKHSVDSVLIDGLWMMRSNDVTEPRHAEVADIMVNLVDIAKKFNVPIDLVHQCSRAADQRRDPRPRLTDLGESVGVERNTYTVIMLFRENYYKRDGSDETEVIVAANRDGNIGTAKLGFDKRNEGYHSLERIASINAPPHIDERVRKDIFQ